MKVVKGNLGNIYVARFTVIGDRSSVNGRSAPKTQTGPGVYTYIIKLPERMPGSGYRQEVEIFIVGFPL